MKVSNIKEYDKKNEINIDVAILLASLSHKALVQLNAFINDYLFYCFGSERISMFRGKKKISAEEFINFCRSRLKLNINSISGDFEERYYYRSLLRNYKCLLKEVMSCSDEVLNKFFETISLDVLSFYQLQEYLLNNYEKAAGYLEKLNKIKSLGISGFVFDGLAKLDDNYTVVVLENREMSSEDKKIYGVKGYACDGEKRWCAQTDVDGYDFVSRNANYMISYVKGTAFRDGINMIVKNLDFDIDTLPSRSELFDLTVLPGIDYDTISKKNRVVNLIYARERSLKAAIDLLKYSKELMYNLEYGGYNAKALEMRKQLIFLESFIATCEGLTGNLATEFINDGVIRGTELCDLVEKRRIRDLEKERNKTN